MLSILHECMLCPKVRFCLLYSYHIGSAERLSKLIYSHQLFTRSKCREATNYRFIYIACLNNIYLRLNKHFHCVKREKFLLLEFIEIIRYFKFTVFSFPWILLHKSLNKKCRFSILTKSDKLCVDKGENPIEIRKEIFCAQNKFAYTQINCWILRSISGNASNESLYFSLNQCKINNFSCSNTYLWFRVENSQIFRHNYRYILIIYI